MTTLDTTSSSDVDDVFVEDEDDQDMLPGTEDSVSEVGDDLGGSGDPEDDAPLPDESTTDDESEHDIAADENDALSKPTLRDSVRARAEKAQIVYGESDGRDNEQQRDAHQADVGEHV